MTLDFYYLAAKALGVELNKKTLDLYGGEHLKPEFLKINPQHTIPTLVDDGFAIWESRPIMIYLVEKYGKEDDPLYPSCPQQRAVINQRLYFDMGSLYKSFAEYFYPQVKEKKPADPEMFKKFEAAMEFLDLFLSTSKYVAGDNMTLADLSILATVSTIEIAQIDFSKYEHLSKWYAGIKDTAPGADENWAGCLECRKFVDNS